MTFVRFPSTPHLAVDELAQCVRADKVFSPEQAEDLLSDAVRVEEKVDGDNLGFSVQAGELRVQHRGDYVRLDEGWRYPHLASWLATHEPLLAGALGGDLVLFGEWCASVHTVRYEALPDWFLAFDVYDRRRSGFWSADRRDALCARLGLSVVPLLATGYFDERGLRSVLGPSKLGSGLMEGVVVRRDEDGWLRARAKVVRPEFLQADDRHWRGRETALNRLDPTRAVGAI
jgi:ATP-dependent RNA circularization protein (DNA/RNA ligase family)